MTRELTVTLPAPHDKQREFIRSKAKRKVVVFARRAGKTMGFAILAAEELLDGRRVLYACPKAEQTDHFWEYTKGFVAELIANGVVTKNETHRSLTMVNGGRIRAKTAFDADTLRGDFADLLILDEYQDMDPDAWDKVGAPMLLDNDGDAVFGGTPKRRNHFYEMYLRAKADDTGRWAQWHYPSTINPYLSQDALDELTHDMTDQAYRQEILAEFLEGEGIVFRNIDGCTNAPRAMPQDHLNHHKIMGLDWGKQNDYTALSIGCITCHREVAKDRYNRLDYAFQRERIKSLFDTWKVASMLPERNSIGDPNIEQLSRDGIPVMRGPDGNLGFNTSAVTKPQLIENLALVFEREEWQFQNDPIWTAELEAYERKISPNTGRPSYNAPEGMHDDTVIARALMAWASRSIGGVAKELEQESRFNQTAINWEKSRWKKY